MSEELSPLIAATVQWLTGAYPASGGALDRVLCEMQAHQAVTVAARLRYPTEMDAALVGLSGPGGSSRLDRLTGVDGASGEDPGAHAWRAWVDEVVASWAACLLTDPELAGRAVAAVTRGERAVDARAEFGRLVAPDAHDRRAAALLRHPDLLAPVTALHRTALRDRLSSGPDVAA
ncbi:hypothetical protein [Streptomyces tropicalis]|uniref:Uncharacterized protein n=1 Tax=Streptomyces tropicalis TaxID=3034234 RepID=A0ABT6A322_9ACTN|nr:hypothetical protein [Streptomyces tropicalis]MDF3299037.1 hypothetical protein [Streptomyces tropicalis]